MSNIGEVHAKPRLSVYYLEYGRHVVRLRRRGRRRRAYAPTSNTASYDNHEKFSSWVFFSFPYEYGVPLGGPLGRRSSAITPISLKIVVATQENCFNLYDSCLRSLRKISSLPMMILAS